MDKGKRLMVRAVIITPDGSQEDMSQGFNMKSIGSVKETLARVQEHTNQLMTNHVEEMRKADKKAAVAAQKKAKMT